MTFEEFASSQRVADTARALSRAALAGQAQDFLDLSQMYFEAPEEAGVELSRELIDRAAWRSVVLGAGIVLGPEGEVPVAVLNERIVAERDGWAPEGGDLFDRLYPLREIRAGQAFLDRWGEGIPSQADLAALIVPEPEPQFQPGKKVSQGARFGTVGCRVTSEDGRPAVLTAGHVVTGVGALVRSDGAIGTVTYCSDPARVPFATVADVAVIVPNGRPSPRAGGLQVSRVASAAAGDRFTSYGVASGPQHMRCAGFVESFYVESMAGQWGHLYMTTAGLTKSGDSGGMVLSPEGDLVGHVVGGSGPVLSFIQDANYQLEQSRARL